MKPTRILIGSVIVLLATQVAAAEPLRQGVGDGADPHLERGALRDERAEVAEHGARVG